MKIKKLGVQLYTIRGFMDTPEQFRESIRKLKDLGYDQITLWDVLEDSGLV